MKDRIKVIAATPSVISEKIAEWFDTLDEEGIDILIKEVKINNYKAPNGDGIIYTIIYQNVFGNDLNLSEE